MVTKLVATEPCAETLCCAATAGRKLQGARGPRRLSRRGARGLAMPSERLDDDIVRDCCAATSAARKLQGARGPRRLSRRGAGNWRCQANVSMTTLSATQKNGC